MSDQITYDDKADLIVDTTIDDIFKVSASDMNEIKNVVNSHADDIDVANNNITDLNNNKLDINEILNQASTDTDKPYSADYLNDKLVLVGSTAPQNGERVWFRKSINLFDNTKITGGYRVNTTLSTINTGVRATSTTTGSANYFATLPLFDVSNYVGKTFTMKCNFTNSGTARGRFIIGLCDKNGGNRIAGKTGNTSGESIFYTIPTLSTSTYLAVWFYVAVSNQVTEGDYVDYTDVQIEEGSTATSYEPYVQPSINVDEEEWYSKPKVLWTNSSPTSEFASQTITLNDSIENYKYYEVICRRTNSSSTIRYFSSGKIPSGQGGDIIFAYYFNFIRTIGSVSGTTMSFQNCNQYQTYGNSTTTTTNSYIIPYQIIGYK